MKCLLPAGSTISWYESAGPCVISVTADLALVTDSGLVRKSFYIGSSRGDVQAIYGVDSTQERQIIDMMKKQLDIQISEFAKSYLDSTNP